MQLWLGGICSLVLILFNRSLPHLRRPESRPGGEPISQDLDFRKLPGPAEIALIIEVADTTYGKDRGLKWRQYAASGIPVYWIVKLDDRRIEVYSDPTGRGRGAQYRSCLTYLESDRVPILQDSFVVGTILPPLAAEEGSAGTRTLE